MLIFCSILFYSSCILLTAEPLNSSSLHNIFSQNKKHFPDYTYYHNLSRIYSEVSDIVKRNFLYIKLDNSFKSRGGLSQMVLRISNFSDGIDLPVVPQSHENVKKLKILFSYGEHARELLPVESLFYFLKNLTNGLKALDGSPEKRFVNYILEKVDLFVIVLLNPDGRKKIEMSHNYCWRGTASGVDLNRNFDWNYGGEGSSSVDGNEELRGPYAFSEPECQVLTTLTNEHVFDGFISFHSGIRQIYLPFADSKSKNLQRKPSNYRGMVQLAGVMSNSIDPHFIYGQAFSVLKYAADGTIFDFMAGVRKIPFSYAVELWGEGDVHGVQCFDLFNPASEKLLTNLASLHVLYEKYFLHLIQWKQYQVSSVYSIEDQPTFLAFVMMILSVLMLFVLIILSNRKVPNYIKWHLCIKFSKS